MDVKLLLPRKIRFGQSFMRLLHRYIVPFVALPLLMVILSGIALLLRSNFETIQPKTRVGSASGLSIDVSGLIKRVVSENPDLAGTTEDVKELRIIPAKGIIKVAFKGNIEHQYDAHTGALLYKGKRWSSLLVAIHEGTFFAPWASQWIFFPSAVLLLILWISGILLYAQRFRIFQRRNRTSDTKQSLSLKVIEKS